MKKLAVLLVLALELLVVGCGTNPTQSPTPGTVTNGSWEAQLTGGTEQASLLNFVTTFSLNNNGTVTSGPLTISAFGFINAGKCFTNGLGGSTESGKATLNTNVAGQVTGTLDFQVVSTNPPGNTLTLTGTVTGTSNGTPTSVGTLSNGVVVGSWNLAGGKGDASCVGGGNFLMCQGTNTCTAP
ncbi:MAG TPA: hypothetical protein VFL34_13645 [Candidatus Sulfotelmatobacter sp.]|nr:hypothetical protein [Candidatus Sulfotelmatobacter sp.]